MNNLISYKLCDLYELGSGISTKPEQAGHGYPFCSFSTIFNNPILPDELPDLMDTSEKERKTYSIKEGDVFFTRTSETVDELAMSSVAIKDYPNATFSGFAKRLRPKCCDKVYPKYMAFFFRSSYFRKIVTNKAVMTLRASFNEDIFNDIVIDVPCYEEQVRIGDCFFLIEKKIRNNKSICSDLESMAKLLYDYWFIQFDFPDENGRPYKSSGGKMVWNDELKREIPVEWKVGNLYEIADYNNGIACQKYYPKKNETIMPVIKISEMHDGVTNNTEYVIKDIPSKAIIDDGSILFSWSATLEIMLWAGGQCGLNQHIFNVLPKKYFGRNYVYETLNEYIINFKKIAESRKTTMGHITKDHISQSRIVLPNKNITCQYEKTTDEIFKRLICLKQENRALKSICDFLLPMLMNGQIKINEDEK